MRSEGALTLETDRLLIRWLSLDDSQFILRLLNEPSFIQNIADRGVRNDNDARSYIQNGPVASYEQFGFGLYLVQLKDSGTPIGICGLLKREAFDFPDLGYALLPEYWSKGYAIEAARSVLNFARNQQDLKRVLAIVNADNVASIRLLEKCDFRFEKTVQLAEDADVQLYACDLQPLDT
jgi:RimJ/RimL family protein N-acetyltransferase